MKIIRELTNLKDKKVLLRVDFDVALENGKIVEPFRILKQKPMIDWLVEKEAKVVMIAHLGKKGESFSDLIPQLHMLLDQEIGFIKKVEDIGEYLKNYSGPGLVENIRILPGELENSDELAKKLTAAGKFNIYINNAFAVCHRKHASTLAITDFLPSYAGFLIEEEVAKLQKAIEAPKERKVLIMGGAKASTKIPVIKNLLDKAEKILLGGVIANDFLKEKGADVKNSVVDENAHELLAGLDLADPRLVMPDDFVWSDNKILDIGERTTEKYAEIIKSAKMTIWNGPMGFFENSDFANGTNAVARFVASSLSYKITGGGDTIRVINQLYLSDKFDFISTGGGAMLIFLAGGPMPGLEALNYPVISRNGSNN